MRMILLSTLLLACAARAQIGGSGSDGPLTPTADITLDTTARPGGFDYTTIVIPAGVTVTVKGSNPAILRSQGGVTIQGTLSADASTPVGSAGGVGGPGGFAGGNGALISGYPGEGPGGGAGGAGWGGSSQAGGPAGHATAGFVSGFPPRGAPGKSYGSAYPFSLLGGSGEGGTGTASSVGVPGPGGGGGGGTLVILCDQGITVSGAITALPTGLGSGGTILLRALAALQVSGRIDARGVNKTGPFWVFRSGDGFIRLDSYGQPPAISGAVTPAPWVRELPELTAAGVPRLGTTWTLTSASVPGDNMALFLSLGGGSLPWPPFGTLKLDPAAGIWLLGLATVPVAEPDPMATLAVGIPADGGLVGTVLHLQAMNASGPLGRPRFTNDVVAAIAP